jgi:GGDEF domain-containing protein
LKEGRKTAAFLYIFLDVTDKQRLIEKLRYMRTMIPYGVIQQGRILVKPIGFFLPASWKAHFSICMIDDDHFQNLNDSCGHIAGNRMLCELAAVFRRIAESAESLGATRGRIPGSPS